MEEVWNDITLSTLTDPRTAADSSVGLQDFLAKPFSSPPPSPIAVPSPPPLTPTALSLNYLDPDHFSISRPVNVQSAFAVSFETNRKRFPETYKNSGDRRFKRMIKNRESAARSRARKQAYTNELEQEIAQLTEENARLRKQQEELCLPATVQLPKKNSLSRTNTSPF